MGGQETAEESDWVIDPQRMKETETEIKRSREDGGSRTVWHAAIPIWNRMQINTSFQTLITKLRVT